MKRVLLKIYKASVKILSGHGIGKFYPIKVVNDFLRYHLKTTFAEVQGHKMFLDSKDTLNLSVDGIHEAFTTELVKREIKRGDVV
ncbi:MAG: hypothetical protein ACP5LE_08310, partial [Thermoplasmata archaeon]